MKWWTHKTLPCLLASFALAGMARGDDGAGPSREAETPDAAAPRELPRNVGRPRVKTKVTTESMASYTEPEAPPEARFNTSPRKSYTYSRYGAGGEAQRVAFERMNRRPPPSGRHADFLELNAGRRMNALEAIPPGPMEEAAPVSQAPPPTPTPKLAPHHMHFNDAGPHDYVDGGPYEGSYDEFDGYDGGSCCDGCGDDCRGDCGSWLWENFSIFGGVQGFRGPFDQGVNSNFGFHEGFNWAFPLMDECGIGWQIGAAAVQSDLNGSFGELNEDRQQYFTTVGMFHRNPCQFGWQWGVAVDFLHDEFLITTDLVQLRSELSYVVNNCHDFGFWSAVHLNHDQFMQSTDLYGFFYRRQFANCATARFTGGFTGEGSGLLEADALMPLSERLALQASAIYLAPQEGAVERQLLEESWALTLSLVWYPGYNSCSCRNPYRPLFNVADNTNFIARFQEAP